MKHYIATFYSHFGAVRFFHTCQEIGCEAKLMPVPRTLSSSCGTCVSFYYHKEWPIEKEKRDLYELEQIVEETDSGYELLFRSENS